MRAVHLAQHDDAAIIQYTELLNVLGLGQELVLLAVFQRHPVNTLFVLSILDRNIEKTSVFADLNAFRHGQNVFRSRISGQP
ncbi:hypothetical protein D1872_263800 [compost metagenome]